MCSTVELSKQQAPTKMSALRRREESNPQGTDLETAPLPKLTDINPKTTVSGMRIEKAALISFPTGGSLSRRWRRQGGEPVLLSSTCSGSMKIFW